MAKLQSNVRLLSLKRTFWKQWWDILPFEKGLQLIKTTTLPVISHLFCSLFSFLFVCTIARIWILSELQGKNFQSIKLNKIPRTKFTRWKRKIYKKLLAKARLLSRTFLSGLRQALNFADFFWLGGVATAMLLSVFESKKRKHPGHFFSLLNTHSKFFNSGFDSECQNQREGKLGPFKFWTEEVAKLYNQGAAAFA